MKVELGRIELKGRRIKGTGETKDKIKGHPAVNRKNKEAGDAGKINHNIKNIQKNKENIMFRRIITVLMLVAVAALSYQGTTWATETSTMDEPTTAYNAYRFQKPDWYEKLSHWVTNTHTTDPQSSRYLLLDTMNETEINYGKDEGKPAIFYVTFEFGRYLLNTLVDSGNYLKLYTLEALEEMEYLNSIMDTGDDESMQRTENASSSCDACNCVTWVRCARASWLPYGLYTLADKKKIMNSKTAGVGQVAVHDIYYPYGHLSYIKKISGSTITIEEANYSKCKQTSRSGTKSGLKIFGYIKK